MKVSVVINTYNRAQGLRKTLLALRYQTYTDFEVVVVNGPSTDGTAAVLEEFNELIRTEKCPEVHLSKSRNIGIDAAAGEVVAFIDDDGIPEPEWIADLVKGYTSEEIGGTGGVVYDHTGTNFQYRYSVCNRIARPSFDRSPPFDEYTVPGADPFVYLQGTNCSFRRNSLERIGGFDEEIEYYLDETEVCMQMIDHGYKIVPLDRAIVHHKYLASHIRSNNKVVLDPYSTVKNHCCFAIRNGILSRPLSEVLEDISKYVNGVKSGGRENYEFGRMSSNQFEHYLNRIEQAVETGIKTGLTKPRIRRTIRPRNAGDFKRYPILISSNERMKVCFVSREFPPDAIGGVGRFTADLSSGFANEGHEVHVITHSPSNTHTVDFEFGVWVHRLPSLAPRSKALQSLILGHNYLHCANVYHEINRIHANAGVDIVAAPIWLVEGLIASLDHRWPTVLELQTTMKTVVALGGNAATPHTNQMIRMEKAAGKNARYIHAISHSIAKKYQEEIGGHNAREFIVHLGTRDLAHRYPSTRDDSDTIQILFVGRLEPRKGIDVLLDAAYELLQTNENIQFILAGKDNTPAGMEPYQEKHQRLIAATPELAHRIQFAGELEESELLQLYANCDILILPSRFESFGLVLTEAMMFGKPVVASNIGGMTEIVDEGVNGYLFEPDDASSLVANLQKLIDSPEIRRTFGIASRHRYEEHFSMDVMTKNTIACYREIIKDHRSRTSAYTIGIEHKIVQMIHSISEVSEEVASSASTELLKSRSGHQLVDFRTEIEKALQLSTNDFLMKTYQLLLNRPIDISGFKLFQEYETNGVSRLEVIREIATSEEARSRQVEIDWLVDMYPCESHLHVDNNARVGDDTGPELLPSDSNKTMIQATTRVENEVLSKDEPKVTIHPRAPKVHIKSLLKSVGRKSVGRIPVLGQLLRKLWHKGRIWWHLPHRNEAILTTLQASPIAGVSHLDDRTERLGSQLQQVQDFLTVHIGWVKEAVDVLHQSVCTIDRKLNVTQHESIPEITGQLAAMHTQLRSLDDTIKIDTYNSLASHNQLLNGIYEHLESTLGHLESTLGSISGITESNNRSLTEISERTRDQANTLQHLADRNSDLLQITTLTKDIIQNNSHALNSASSAVQGNIAWLSVITRKLQMMAMDLRERVTTVPESGTLPEPRIPDPVNLAERIRSLGGQIRLNLGAGEKPLSDYINCDARHLPDTQIVADIRALPFEAGSVDEIASSHLVEHFREHHLETVILPYWKNLLRPGGTIRIICPNWGAMIQRLNDGRMSYADFKLVTFGGQDYQGDDHFAMYTPESLCDLLERAGFNSTKIIAHERMNGLCPEMELTAQSPPLSNTESMKTSFI